MKKLIFCFLLLFISKFALSQAQYRELNVDTNSATFDKFESQTAVKHVENFVKLILENRVRDSLFNFCSLPFVEEGVTYKTSLSLQRHFDKTASEFASKPNRIVSIDSAYVMAVEKGNIHNMVPINIYYVVLTLKFNNNGQIIKKSSGWAVQVSDMPKIVGVGLN